MKRMTAIWLLLALLLCACAGQGESATEAPDFLTAEELSYRHYDEYRAAKRDISLEAGEIVLDVMEEDGGFCVLTGMPVTDREEQSSRYRCTNEGTLHTAWLRYFDENWQEDRARRAAVPEDAFEGLPARFTRYVSRMDDSIYTVAALPQYEDGVVDPNGSLSEEERREQSYFVACRYGVFEGETLLMVFAGGNAAFMLDPVQLYVEDGTAYALMWENVNRTALLYIHPQQSAALQHDLVTLPSESGRSFRLCGVASLGGQMYAVLAAEDNAKGEACGLLAPVNGDTTVISLDGAKRIAAVPTGMCATEGELAYFMSGAELYATDGAHTEKLANIEQAGFNRASTVRRILPVHDGRILLVVDGQLVELTATDEAYVSTTTTLVLGYVAGEANAWELEKRIARFNKQEGNITVQMKEYADEAHLHLAVLSQEVDLIASCNVLLLRGYADKGVLAPFDALCPSLLEEGTLLENIVEASRFRGQVYYLPTAFQLYVYTLPVTVEEQTFPTLAALYQQEQAADGRRYRCIEQSAEAEWLLCHNLDNWIDWENGKAHFDDGEVAALLAFIHDCCAASEDEAIANMSGAPRLTLTQIAERHAVDVFSACYDAGQLAWYFAPPGAHHGAQIWPDNLVAAVKSGREEAAAAVLEFLFSEDRAIVTPDDRNGCAYGFPVNREEYLFFTEPDLSGDAYHALEKEASRIVRDIAESADHYVYWEHTISPIIMEEAQRLFRNEITAEQAAGYIQNRVQLYLDEQG